MPAVGGGCPNMGGWPRRGHLAAKYGRVARGSPPPPPPPRPPPPLPRPLLQPLPPPPLAVALAAAGDPLRAPPLPNRGSSSSQRKRLTASEARSCGNCRSARRYTSSPACRLARATSSTLSVSSSARGSNCSQPGNRGRICEGYPSAQSVWCSLQKSVYLRVTPTPHPRSLRSTAGGSGDEPSCGAKPTSTG